MESLIVYFSKYGQTRKIAHRMADTLTGAGHHVRLRDAYECQKMKDLDGVDLVILGSPIYATKHSKLLSKFIKKHRHDLSTKTTAFFSVSLSAAGDETQKKDAQDAMRTFLNRCIWEPTKTAVFAGHLPYREYGWFTRLMMKRIVAKSGGDTDTSQNYEYTDWKRVEQFAMTCALATAPHPPHPSEP